MSEILLTSSFDVHFFSDYVDISMSLWIISFFLSKREYIKLASRLIKNLPVPLGTLVRKRARLKPAAIRHIAYYIV